MKAARFFTMKFRLTYTTLILIFFIIGLPACQSAPEPANNTGKLKVIATTTIVGDVVSRVGGDLIDLSVLLPVGADPHSFSPAPQDIARVADADLVFANGVGLEAFLDNLIEGAGAQERVISVSEGIALMESGIDHGEEESSAHSDEHGSYDPHTWTSPRNVMVWVQNIEAELSQLDPDNAQTYQNNAAGYSAELTDLDTWIHEQTDSIPPEDKKIVTDHALFGYYAAAYGFQQIGALIPGYSTLSEPSAQDLARIEDAIRQYEVKAIFVGKNVNPMLATRVAEDTGTLLVSVYTGSLSETGGEAGTYLDYMRYNTTAFVTGLK
jgi:ABC-type Zn uptake system ZnuABC Zn-binding protein ZnuA